MVCIYINTYVMLNINLYKVCYGFVGRYTQSIAALTSMQHMYSIVNKMYLSFVSILCIIHILGLNIEKCVLG